MKLLTTLCLASFSFAFAQEAPIESYVKPVTIVQVSISTIEDTSNPESNFLFYDDKSFLAKKKSYKNIIENTLSGNKHLVFKIKRSTKVC